MTGAQAGDPGLIAVANLRQLCRVAALALAWAAVFATAISRFGVVMVGVVMACLVVAVVLLP